jgi:hypothetical protein
MRISAKNPLPLFLHQADQSRQLGRRNQRFRRAKKAEHTKGLSSSISAIFFSKAPPLSAPFSRRVWLFRSAFPMIVYQLLPLSSTKTWSLFFLLPLRPVHDEIIKWYFVFVSEVREPSELGPKPRLSLCSHPSFRFLQQSLNLLRCRQFPLQRLWQSLHHLVLSHTNRPICVPQRVFDDDTVFGLAENNSH